MRDRQLSDQAEPARHRVRLWLVLFAMLVTGATAQSYLLLMFPPLGRQLGMADLHSAGLLGGGALLGIVCAPLWGRLSERHGRLRILLAAQVLASFGWILMGVTISLRFGARIDIALTTALLLLARAIQVVGSAGMLPAALALIADRTALDRRTRGMGLIGAAYGLGGIIGGALMWNIGLADVGRLMAAFGAVGLIVFACLIFLRKTERDGGPIAARMAQIPWRQVLRRGSLALLISTLCGITAFGIVKQVTALYLEDVLGLPGELAVARTGMMMMGTAAAMVAVQALVIPFLTCRPEALQGAGAALAVVSLLICSTADGLFQVTTGVVALGIAVGLMLPGNLGSLSLRTGLQGQGEVAGLNVMAHSAGLVLGPLLGGTMHRLSPVSSYPLASVLMSVSLVLSWHIWRTRKI